MKALRLVSRDWRDATLARWRENAVLVLVQDPAIFRTTTAEGMLISEFLNTLESETSLFKINSNPFCSYKLRQFSIDVHACFQLPQATRFWDQIGPLIKYLHFDSCKFLANKEGDIVQLLVRNTPNLKALALENVGLKELCIENPNYMKSLGNDKLKIQTLAISGGVKISLTNFCEYLPELEVLSNLKLF